MKEKNKEHKTEIKVKKSKLADRMKESIVENDPLKDKKMKDKSKGYRK